MADDIIAVDTIRPGPRPMMVEITWESGGRDTVDLAGLIARDPELASLADPAVFRKVAAADWGWGAEWPGGVSCSARVLWRLARDQRSWTTADFLDWQAALGLSNQEAADVLGVTPRTIEYYRSGKPISRPVQIACLAIRDDPGFLDAYYRPRRPGRPRKPSVTDG